MTKQEIGQLLMIGIPANGDLTAVHELQPGGVVLMGRNAGDAHQIRKLTRAIREASAARPLIAVDQEGGRVQRLTQQFTRIPPMRELGAEGAMAVKLTAMTVAAELRDVGISCNFAPVCDVPVAAGDTVISDRAFGSDPLKVAPLVAEYIRGVSTNILCCAKHFPGHGGVEVDSHSALPVYTGTASELSSLHLSPFRAAIAAGVGAIMVGHISVPDIDATGLPASLSPAIVSGLLRDQMNFRGLIITDDLEMGALESFTIEEIAVGAINAGCDMLLWCHSTDKARRAVDAILIALDTGVLSESSVHKCLERVSWVKKKYGALPLAN